MKCSVARYDNGDCGWNRSYDWDDDDDDDECAVVVLTQVDIMENDDTGQYLKTTQHVTRYAKRHELGWPSWLCARHRRSTVPTFETNRGQYRVPLPGQSIPIDHLSTATW